MHVVSMQNAKKQKIIGCASADTARLPILYPPKNLGKRPSLSVCHSTYNDTDLVYIEIARFI
jgi:hypothetical protein